MLACLAPAQAWQVYHISETMSEGRLPYGDFAVIGNDALNKWGEYAADAHQMNC